MSRQFSDDVSNVGKAHLATLADVATEVSAYSNALYQLGKELGNVVSMLIENRNEFV
ncbi:MAG: hypothetical protein R3E08_07860 [Thiotrichaceae bacterium]